jgi:hypothetical protein
MRPTLDSKVEVSIINCDYFATLESVTVPLAKEGVVDERASNQLLRQQSEPLP